MKSKTGYDDEYFRDILDGLSAYYSSTLIADLLTTINKVPAPGLGNAWNFNQITGKRWLVETLAKHVDAGALQNVLLLGGWYGVLASLLLDHPAFSNARVSSLDIDPDCEKIARSINQSWVDQDRFEAFTADMHSFEYPHWKNKQNLIINTSCEHIEAFEQWFDRVPTGPLLTLQSNDYYSCDEHVNCVPSLADFTAQAPLTELYFSGELKLKKYTRFMLIGRK